MATRIGISELRNNLSKAMRQVRNGETIEVTRRGILVAVIHPVARSRLDVLLEAGLVEPPSRPLDLAAIGPRPVTGPMTASEALEADRGS
jgi:prevent-host-death family protein